MRARMAASSAEERALGDAAAHTRAADRAVSASGDAAERESIHDLT